MLRQTIRIGASLLAVLAATTGTIATPTSSRPQFVVPFFIAEGNPRTGFRSSDRQLAAWAFDAWERSSDNGLRFEAATEAQALVRLYWSEPSDGQYGEMQTFMNGAKRGAALYIRPDMDSLGPDIARRARTDPLLRESIVYLTCVHELGHALGLSHTHDFQDIMYFFGYGGDIAEYFGRYRSQLRSRDDIARTSGLSTSDVSRLRELLIKQF